MRRLALATAMVAVLYTAAPAAADHGVLDLVSTGPTAQPCPAGVNCAAAFLGASADGTRALIRTKQPLVPQDSNDADDVYEWHDGTVRRIAQGLTSAFISEDGSRIVFATTGALVPEDTDGTFPDVYELTGSTLRLISAPPAGSSVAASASALDISADSSSVFFLTNEALDALDTDVVTDIYEREGNALRLVTAGVTSGGTHTYAGASDDGARVFFGSTGQMVPEDLDGGNRDYYERSGGTTSLVSTGPADSNSFWGFTMGCCFLSADGADVAFDTQDSFVPGDSDVCTSDTEDDEPCFDVYRRSGGTTTHVTPGGSCTDFALFLCHARIVAISDDGDRIVFVTRLSYAPEDTGGWDVYEWDNGVITLLSVGPSGAAMDFSSSFGAGIHVSDDLDHVFFETRSSLTPDDTDGNEDVYERSGGTTRLLTPTALNPPTTGVPYTIADVAGDGSAAFVSTGDAFVAEDTNGTTDLYELSTAGATLLTSGPTGQGGGLAVGPATGLAEEPFRRSVSADGGRVFLTTTSQLVAQDTDSEADIYLRRRPTTTGYPRPQGATPLRVPLVPAAAQCLAPNRQHGPPLAFGSCNPVQPLSPNLTVGVGDGSPALAKSEGHIQLVVVPGVPGGVDDADVNIRLVLTNVMNKPSLSDYTGELRATANVRLTDRVAGVPSTTDLPFGFTVPCTATADTTLGGDCRVLTSVDAVVPGAAAEGTRAVWAMDQWKVQDGGPDGDAETGGDNSLLAVQGIFVP